MYTKHKSNYIGGIKYICGCKPKKRRSAGLGSWYELSEIHEGQYENGNNNTIKLLSMCREGLFGEEWRQIIIQHPDWTLCNDAHLYICDECGYWSNEEDLSICSPLIELKPSIRTTSIYIYGKPIWKKEKEYIHKCPSCSSRMRDIGLIGVRDPLAKNDITFPRTENYKKICREHLICPKCKKRVVVLSLDSSKKGDIYYEVTENGNKGESKTIDDWISYIKSVKSDG